MDVAGHHIVYLDGGKGTPVVLLHGFGANKDLWDSVAAQLTPHYPVIAPDLPGFGDSPAVDGQKYDARSQAQRVHALLTALGVREFHIGGNSMGGLIAIETALRGLIPVRGFVVNGPAIPFLEEPEELEKLLPLADRDGPAPGPARNTWRWMKSTGAMD